jgi:acetyltransferase-like isoleucine patch superfamily enzyme
MKKKITEILRRIYYFNYYLNFKNKGNQIILSKGGLINNPSKVDFGSNIYIGRDFKINSNGGVKIMDNVMIGPNLLIESDDHVYSKVGVPMFFYRNEKINGQVIIEKDVWIGGNVTILKGVTIGEGSIIGACSLVNKNIPPYSISVGIPCKKIRPRFSKEELELHLLKTSSNYSIKDLEILFN